MSHRRLLPRSVPSAERMDARSVLALLDRLGERSEGAEWDRVASGATFGFHGLHLTTEQVAAFGELLLRHGRWRHHQPKPRP